MKILVATVGLTEPQSALLRSLLRLLDRQLDGRFAYTPDAQAARLWIVPIAQATDPAFSQGAPVLIGLAARGQSGPVAMAARAGQPIDEPLVLHHPLSVTEVMAVLNRVGRCWAPSAPMAPVPLASHTSLLDALSAAIHSHAVALQLVQWRSGPVVVVDVARNVLLCDRPREALVAAWGEEVMVRAYQAATDPSVTRLAETGGVFPLDALAWDMAHARSSTQAGRPLVPHVRYRLLHWPDSRALQREHYTRLAALMSLKTLTVTEVCAATLVERATVVRFIEAALACGLAVASHEASPAPVKAAPPVQAAAEQVAQQRPFLSRLRARLRIW